MSLSLKINLNSSTKDELIKAYYKAGYASSRLKAIGGSMDAVAALIIKAEMLQVRIGENSDQRCKKMLDINYNHCIWNLRRWPAMSTAVHLFASY